MGREYIASHRVYQQLAVRLSNVGFHVLRFDFFGCGDSSGDSEQGRIPQWLNDITTAVNKIRERCNLTKVCLAGVRLGGTLSLMAGAERGDIESIVLWDPVVNGKDYIEELTTLQQEMLVKSKVRRDSFVTDQVEILGFAFHRQMLGRLAEVDLLSVRRHPANNILIVESGEKTRDGKLVECLERVGADVEYQRLPGPAVWVERDDPLFNILGPRRILGAVVSWISRTHQ